MRVRDFPREARKRTCANYSIYAVERLCYNKRKGAFIIASGGIYARARFSSRGSETHMRKL